MISGISSAISPSALTSANTGSKVGVAMLSKSLDTQQQAGSGLVKMMEQSVNPSIGSNFDASC